MADQKATYEEFLFDVPPTQRPFVDAMNEYLLAAGCTVDVKLSKTGYVVSYVYEPTKRVMLNYVFRKKGMFMRLYADHLDAYAQMLETLPAEMQKHLGKTSPCRRLLDPTKCNARCPMGYVFTLNGEEQKKCRYNCFLFLIDDESAPFLREMVEAELKARSAA